eukprot:g81102.t1
MATWTIGKLWPSYQSEDQVDLRPEDLEAEGVILTHALIMKRSLELTSLTFVLNFFFCALLMSVSDVLSSASQISDASDTPKFVLCFLFALNFLLSGLGGYIVDVSRAKTKQALLTHAVSSALLTCLAASAAAKWLPGWCVCIPIVCGLLYNSLTPAVLAASMEKHGLFDASLWWFLQLAGISTALCLYIVFPRFALHTHSQASTTVSALFFLLLGVAVAVAASPFLSKVVWGRTEHLPGQEVMPIHDDWKHLAPADSADSLASPRTDLLSSLIMRPGQDRPTCQQLLRTLLRFLPSVFFYLSLALLVGCLLPATGRAVTPFTFKQIWQWIRPGLSEPPTISLAAQFLPLPVCELAWLLLGQIWGSWQYLWHKCCIRLGARAAATTTTTNREEGKSQERATGNRKQQSIPLNQYSRSKRNGEGRLYSQMNGNTLHEHEEDDVWDDVNGMQGLSSNSMDMHMDLDEERDYATLKYSLDPLRDPVADLATQSRSAHRLSLGLCLAALCCGAGYVIERLGAHQSSSGSVGGLSLSPASSPFSSFSCSFSSSCSSSSSFSFPRSLDGKEQTTTVVKLMSTSEKQLPFAAMLPVYALLALADVTFTLHGLRYASLEFPAMNCMMKSLWLVTAGLGFLLACPVNYALEARLCNLDKNSAAQLRANIYLVGVGGMLLTAVWVFVQTRSHLVQRRQAIAAKQQNAMLNLIPY